MNRHVYIANCILLLNNFDELKNQEGELFYKIETRTDTIFFYFPIKSFNFIIDFRKKEVRYKSYDGFLNKETLLLLYEIIDLFEKEFSNNEVRKME